NQAKRRPRSYLKNYGELETRARALYRSRDVRALRSEVKKQSSRGLKNGAVKLAQHLGVDVDVARALMDHHVSELELGGRGPQTRGSTRYSLLEGRPHGQAGIPGTGKRARDIERCLPLVSGTPAPHQPRPARDTDCYLPVSMNCTQSP